MKSSGKKIPKTIRDHIFGTKKMSQYINLYTGMIPDKE